MKKHIKKKSLLKNQTSKMRWNSLTILSIIFIVALAARLLSLFLDPVLQRDGALYIFMAERWQETGDYSQTITKETIVPPLPLYSMVKLMDCGLSAEIAGRSIGLFLGAMIPVLGYCVTYKIFKDILISGCSAILFIFHPSLISYSIQPLRENYYLFFLGLIILTTINGFKQNKLSNWGLCGLLLAFSIYSRYESLELLVFYPFVMLYLTIKGKMKIQKAISYLCVLFATCIVTCILLLSITDYNISFVTKLPQYTNKVVWQNDVRDFYQINSKSLE